MKLSISKVHRILGQVLGAEAVTLQNYVTRVEEDSISIGVILGSDGVMYYDPDWWAANVDTPQKARHVILFEIMKCVLGVPRRRGDWISRVAVGAVINSYLFHTFGYDELPAHMYSAKDLPECLMRPRSRGYHSRLKRVYKAIWTRKESATNIANVERWLRILFKDTSMIPDHVDPNAVEVPGYAESMEGDGEGEGEPGEGQASGGGSGQQSRGHGNANAGNIQNPDTNHDDRLPGNLLEHMANGVQNKASQSAGYSEVVNDSIVKRMKSHKSLESTTIDDYILDNIHKQIRKEFEPAEPEQSMIPIKLTKRDVFKLAMGWMPMYYEVDAEKEVENGTGGIAIYMDVSGSFHQFIPYTLGVIQCVEDMVEKVFQFSNVVEEIPFEDIKGDNVRIKSTGGTDFDCVLRHAMDNDYDKIMIITDGWADVNNPDIRKEAESKVDKVLVTLITQLPGGSHYQRGDEMTGEVEGDPYFLQNDQIKKQFLEGTWLGKRYGKVVMMSEAFRDKIG